MQITSKQLKQIIKEELDNLIGESKKMIPSGPKAMEYVQKMISDKFGKPHVVRAQHFGGETVCDDQCWDYYYTISVFLEDNRYAEVKPIEIVRAKNLDTNQHVFTLSDGLGTLKEIPATLSALSGEGIHWIKEFLNTMVDHKGEEEASKNSGEEPVDADYQ